MSKPPKSPTQLFADVAGRLDDEDVFEKVTSSDQGVIATAPNGIDAAYRADIEGDSVYVGFYTPDRWLSESIEAELMHTGDDLPELIEEELVDLGGEALVDGDDELEVEHFRDDDKRYVFRSRCARPNSAKAIAIMMLAYQAAFAELGDVTPGEEEE